MRTNQDRRRGITPWWLIWPALAGLLVLLLSGHRDHVLDFMHGATGTACTTRLPGSGTALEAIGVRSGSDEVGKFDWAGQRPNTP